MTTRQHGYVCYSFTCDHDNCTIETLMSDTDQLSAALRLSQQGWGFEVSPGTGPALAFCPLHEAERSATVVPLPSSP